jgi:hypothetical protein
MGRPIRTDETGAVQRKANGKVLDRDVVDQLVIGALEEGRVDCAERAIALRGKSGSEGYGMLFGNADIEGAVGEFGLKLIEDNALANTAV